MMKVNFGRGSQVVRHGSAKAVFVGSIPTLASIFAKDPEKTAHLFSKSPVSSQDERVFAAVGGTCFAEGGDSKS